MNTDRDTVAAELYLVVRLLRRTLTTLIWSLALVGALVVGYVVVVAWGQYQVEVQNAAAVESFGLETDR